MNPNSQLLRQIPKIDDLLRREEITAAAQSYSHTVVVESLRETTLQPISVLFFERGSERRPSILKDHSLLRL